MRFSRDGLWLLAVSICACAALGVAAFGLGSGELSTPLIAVSLIALAIGLVITQMREVQRAGAMEAVSEESRRTARQVAALASETEATRVDLTQRVDALRAESVSVNENLASTINELRNSQIEVANSLKSIVEQSRPYQPVPDQQVAQAVAADPQPSWPGYNPAEPQNFQPAEPVAMAFEDSLTLALEPVVDLFTSKTAHYRLILGMMKAGGEDVAQELFLHHADQTGQRPALDCFVVAETIGILRKLRQRDRNLCIFMPVGASTLANRDAMASILQASNNAADVANGLIFELHHSVLASLPEASLEGLATLARAGLTLSLSQASIAGIDLASLDRLNVRFVGLNAASIGIDNRISNGLGGFIQAARALRINIVITQVADPRHVLSLQKTARYASGPAFAAPRRLRRNVGNETAFTVAA